jgi:alpha-beta hydrolase superfamily lysophospholipase
MDAALAAAPGFRAPGLFLYGGKDDLIPKQATAATWRALPGGDTKLAYYPGHYHLAMRDLGRGEVIRDVIGWMRHPDAPLASGADQAADSWIRSQAPGS